MGGESDSWSLCISFSVSEVKHHYIFQMLGKKFRETYPVLQTMVAYLWGTEIEIHFHIVHFYV